MNPNQKQNPNVQLQNLVGGNLQQRHSQMAQHRAPRSSQPVGNVGMPGYGTEMAGPMNIMAMAVQESRQFREGVAGMVQTALETQRAADPNFVATHG
jgi:hypothetical protein